MSSSMGSATGYLLLDASGVEKGVNQAGAALNKITDITRSSYFGLRNLAMGFELVGDAALGALGFALKAAMDWQTGMAHISAATNDSSMSARQNAEAMHQVDAGLRQLASSTPASISSILSLGSELAQAGLRGQGLVETERQVIALNQLTGASFDQIAPFIAKTVQSMGLGSDGARRLASSLYETSRQSAATITDVTQLNQRLQGLRAETGMSEAGTIALANAIGLVPQQSRMAVGGIQKMGDAITEAVRTGNTSLNDLASIGGYQDSQAFAKAWQGDPTKAMAAVIQGIGHIQTATGGGEDAIRKLGVTETRQVQSLLAIAVAQDHVRGTTQDLTQLIDISNAAWANGNNAMNAVQQIYGTAASQLSILHNNISLAGQAFASDFLPTLNPILHFLTEIIVGLSSLPGPVRTALAVMTALVGVVGALGGALLFILPKFVLARQSLVEMAAAQSELAASQAEAAVVASQMTEELAVQAGIAMEEAEAMGLDAAATQAYVAAALEAGGASEAAAVAMAEAAVAEGVEAAATGTLAAAFDVLLASIGPVGWIMLAIGAAVAILSAFLAHLAGKHKEAAAAADEQTSANQGLMDAINQEANGVNKATDAWILHKLAMDGVLGTLRNLKISAPEAVDIVKGTGDPNANAANADTIAGAAKGGDKGAAKAASALSDQISVYRASVAAVNALSNARNEDGIAAGTEADAITDANGKILTSTEIAKKEAQARIDLVDAKLQEAAATLSLGDANDRLAEAQQQVADKGLLVQRAEDQITRAKDAGIKANDDLIKDEQALATVRQRAADEYAAAQRKLAGDQLSLQRATLAIDQAQVRLNQDMEVNGPKDYRNAILSLAEAESNLWHANENLADAQYQLNYLMQEGASQRDIADAAQAVVDAQNKQTDATNKLTDSQDSLNKITAGPDQNQILADQLSLQQAYLDQADALANVAAQTQTVAQLQLGIASDAAYHDALSKVDADHAAINQALIDEHEAQVNLHAIQNGSIERNLAGAIQGVETAHWSLAKAHANTLEQTAAINGVFWTETERANAVRDALANGAATIDGPVGIALRALAAGMGTAVDPTNRVGGALSGVAGSAQNVKNALDQANQGVENHKSTWRRFIDDIGQWITDLVNLYNKIPSALRGVLAFGPELVSSLASAAGNAVGGHAEGGIFSIPHIAHVAEDGPEVIIPLTDADRARQLVQQSGLLELIGSNNTNSRVSANIPGIASSSTTHVTHNEGDHITIPVRTDADPDEIAEELAWRKMRRQWG